MEEVVTGSMLDSVSLLCDYSLFKRCLGLLCRILLETGGGIFISQERRTECLLCHKMLCRRRKDSIIMQAAVSLYICAAPPAPTEASVTEVSVCYRGN